MTSAVPEGWQVSSIQELLTRDCLFSDGDWVESKDQDQSGTNRLLQLADIGDGSFLDRSNRFMNDEQFARLDCTQLKEGDILIARMPEPIGRACILPRLANRSATVVDVAVLRPSEINSYWLMSVINSAAFRAKVEEQSSGTTRTRIGRTALSRIELLLPPLHEQKKIASILNSVDEVIENTQKQIDKLQDLKKATMNKLLTKGIGHTEFRDSELGRIPKDWEVRTIRELVEKVVDNRGKTPPLCKHGRELIEIASISKEDRFLDYELSKKRVSEETYNTWFRNGHPKIGDVLVPTVGLIGHFSIVREERGCIAQNLIALRSSEGLLGEYLYWVMYSHYVLKEIQRVLMGAVQPSIKVPHLLDAPIPLPSLSEQQKITKALNAIEDDIIEAKKKVLKTSGLKRSLMQDLLTGKVRVNLN